MKNRIKFQIGDWSDDGHGKCDNFTVVANKSTEEVREAFFTACKKMPKCTHPTEIFSDYEDHSLEKKTYETVLEHGYDFLKAFKEDPERPEGETFEDQLEYPQVDTSDMLDYLLWFLKQGDPELELKTDPKAEDNTFAFYGSDKKGRHIDFIGYGLF